MITEILGTAFIIVTATLCICIASRLITSSIIDEVEKWNERKTKRKLNAIGKVAEILSKTIIENAEKLKNIDENLNKGNYNKATKEFEEYVDDIPEEDAKEFEENIKDLLR